MDMIIISSEALHSLPWLLLPLLLPLLFFFFIKRTKINVAKSSINLPPSPPRLPLIGNLHQLGKIPHRSLHQLSLKYGPVMLLQLGQIPTLIVSSPETAKEVMKTHDLECCSRPNSHGIRKISYNLSDIAFGPYTDYWREMRKLCMIELFTAKRVKSFSRIREAEVSRIIDSILRLRNTPVNLSEKAFDLTNGFICRAAFGKSYEGRQFGGGKFEDTIDEAMEMLSSFWASDFFPAAGRVWDAVVGKYKRLDECFSKLDGFFERVIEEHVFKNGGNSEHEDIVDILLRLSKDQTGGFRLTRDHIKAVLMDIFIGGIDTSSLTIVWAMTELARNPRTMTKVQNEVRQVVGRKKIVSDCDINNLKYLHMVVKETFRLHPPATLLLPRETMSHCKIGGYEVFPKTRILVGAWAIGRDPTTWNHPNKFYPERFEDNVIDFQGSNFELIPFGAGRRICPGLMMGVTTVEFTLANLLHRFDWELPQGIKIDDISMEEEAGLTVHKKFPLYLVPVDYTWECMTTKS